MEARVAAAAVYDAHYQRKRDRGQPGWIDATGYADIFSRLLPRLEAAGPLGPRVLEVGCGAGNLSALLIEKGFDVTGVDISPSAIAWALESFPNGRFVCGDIREPSVLGGKQFDWVLDGFCWHFICEGRAAFLSRLFNLLTPAGLFLVSALCGAPEAMPGMVFDAERRVQIVDGVPVTYFGEKDGLEAELTGAGFEIVRSVIDPAVSGVRAAHLLVDARKPAG